MVQPVHHATLAKANKLGFTLTGGHADEAYTIIWPERNQRFTHRDPKQAVEDMRIVKMIALEYPELTAVHDFDNAAWNVCRKVEGRKRPELMAAAATLEDAFDLALMKIAEQGAKKPRGGNRKALRDSVKEEEDGDDNVEDGENFSGEGGEDQDEEDEDDGAEGSKSIIKRKYKTKYRPFKQTNGDDLVQSIATHLKTLTNPNTGKPMVDPAKLEKFARLNNVWQDGYAYLNVGMRRLNVGNRLRAKVRKGHEIVWN